MGIFLSIFAIVISILAIVITQWITFLPGLGISFQYHRRKAQIVIALIANLTALGLFLANPSVGQLLVLAVVVLLTPLSGFNYAANWLVATDNPIKVSAAEADWPADVQVIGWARDGQSACAWLLKTLIPHHLVNDEIGDVPVLAAW